MIFDKYPYTNFHELNDDWIIKTLREFGQRLDEFVAANQLTYADPIAYDPDTIYAANTVVIYDNAAYVSKQAIPAGLLPTNAEYWLLIFPFGDLIDGAVEDMERQIDEALAAAQNQLETAINTLPSLVNTWMTAHPDVVSAVPSNSVNWQKLNQELRNVILADYVEAAETRDIVFTEQGGLHYSTGAEFASAESCRTGFLHFPVGVVVFNLMPGYQVAVLRYDAEGNYIGYTFVGSAITPAVGVLAVAVAAGEQYRFDIIIDGLTQFTPADLPYGVLLYQVYSPEFLRAETEILSSVSATGTSSGTNNAGLGGTITQGTVCNVEITASEANPNRNITLYWRNSSGNLNIIGTLPQGQTHAIFKNVSPNADATTLRLNYTVSGATYDVLITKQNQVNQFDELNKKCDSIGDKTPIAEVLRFSLGYWASNTSFTPSANYRVGAAPYVFDKDVVISSFNGFYIGGYVDGVTIGTVGQVTIPKNKIAKLYIRKVWEDTTTPVTIEEMTDNVYILNLNKLTEYERLSDTFAGLEMFRTVGFVGDSYTATRLGMSWVDIVQQRTGVSCTLFAKSGDDSGAWLTDNANGLPALNADAAKDAYWIALGINDGDRVDSNPNYLGSIADISGSYADYPDTFYGNYAHIIEAIQAHAPNAKIVLYKPIYRSQSRTLWGVSATQNGIKQVRDAIGTIAEHYGLPVMDALDDILYRSQWYTGHLDTAVSAGNHPAVMMYPAIAAANMRLFSKAVQKYDTYFMNLRYN